MDIEVVKELLKGLVIEVEKHIPGATGQEKEDWVVTMALSLVEMGDGFIPVIGKWMDLPVVDGVEKYIIQLGVRWAYAAVKTGLGVDPVVQQQLAAQLP
jgi:hypothetical protein